MRRFLIIPVTAGALLVCLFGPDQARLIGAEDETKLTHSKRGGILVATEGHRFEVFFYPTGVRLIPLDFAGKALDSSRLSASATFYSSRTAREPWFTRTLLPDPSETDQAPSSLVLSLGLAQVPEKVTMVAFEIMGLSGPTASTAAFKIPLEFVGKNALGARLASENRTGESAGNDGYLASVILVPTTADMPQATPAYAGTPTNSAGNTPTKVATAFLMRRDWTTGRSNLPLAKPWLPSR